MEKSIVSKALLKVIGFAGSLFLTILSGIFALMALSALFMSVIEKDFVSVIGCVASGIIAWILWSVRKDTLI